MRDDKFLEELGLAELDSSESSSGGINDWSVPWSDLMMVMFVLFVVLFIYSQSKENIKVIFSGNAESGVSSSPVDSLIDSISMHRAGASPDSKVELPPQQSLFRSSSGAVSVNTGDDGEVKIVMRGDTFFAPGKVELDGISRKYLDEIVGILETNRHAIHVIGHCDDTDISKIGRTAAFELSADRAAKVAEYLIGFGGIDPGRFMVSGRGATKPELPSAVQKVSGNNRRVEIYILNTGNKDS
ncbi:OmpA/MotB family protein [Maridesulfovibrio bastinii]|uniref:OmpA/MotB family protein n=1 Tax=Maridesulfovibrio bastinii TaxID=47157 RepID=UPI0004212BE9|nr:OmpA family protein [Maridesulfovibrio bastinii]